MGKHPAKSRTVWVNAAAIILAFAIERVPAVRQTVCSNPELTLAIATTALQMLACLNVLLRAVTKEPIKVV